MSLFLSYEGRIGRGKFWLGFLLYALVSFFAGEFVLWWTGDRAYALLSSLPFLYFLFAVTSKRFHDHGKSGWHSLWWFAPFVGAVYVVIECGLWRGSPMRNRYGDPLHGPLVSKRQGS